MPMCLQRDDFKKSDESGKTMISRSLSCAWQPLFNRIFQMNMNAKQPEDQQEEWEEQQG